MRCVQINEAGIVIAAILWGEEGLPPADAGLTWLASDEAQPGWVLRNETLTPPSVKVDREALTAAINDRRDALLAGGFPVPGTASAALAGEVLQTRDADDKVNWKLSRDAYKEAIQAGYGEAPQATFRTSGNRTITVTIREGFAVLEAMQAWGVAVLGRSWTLKDAVAAADEAVLDTIDITAGWPE